MVIVQLFGGLGNQLFQYAAGRAIAYRNNVPLKLDLSRFESYQLREYRLNHFKIAASIASPAEITNITGTGKQGVRGWIYRLLQRSKPYFKRSVIKEPHYRPFDPNILRASDNVHLVGYWQSEKYFKDIEQLLRREFKVKHAQDEINQHFSRLIYQTTSVSLHVRRGDYVSNPKTHQVHGLCSLDYYQTAIEKLTRVIEQPHFFIFSDDIEWTKQNLLLKYTHTYVTHNGAEKDYEDLRLMSQCKHHIIANSSFSWWGAWLCTNPDKIVFAPKEWFNKEKVPYDTSDLIPASWIRI